MLAFNEVRWSLGVTDEDDLLYGDDHLHTGFAFPSHSHCPSLRSAIESYLF